MTVDDVYDNAVEKKSPLILNNIADGNYNCDPPSLMMRYYNCNGKGVLESVETYEDERIELRDPPPALMQDLQKIAEDESAQGETTEDETRDPAISNGLLAKARRGTASSVVLEAGKQQHYEKQSIDGPQGNSKTKKRNLTKSFVEIPFYAKLIGNKDIDEVEDDVSEDTAVLVAAAAKWRIAKELHTVRSSFSTESEQVLRGRYSFVRDESNWKETDEKIVALPTDAEVAAAATKQSEEALRDQYSVVHDESNWNEMDEKIACFPPIQNNKNVDAATDAHCRSADEASHAHKDLLDKHLLDPPGGHRAENYYAIKNELEPPSHNIRVEPEQRIKAEPEPSYNNEDNDNDNELPGHDEEQNQLLLPDEEAEMEEGKSQLPLYARTLSVSLKQLEKQQFTNQSRLSEQRLRLERRKKHRMQRQQTTKSSLPI